MARRTARARWEGSLTEGGGAVTLGRGAFDCAYDARSRFEDGAGTNPEELIAGAHAGCYSMALSLVLGQAGHEPEAIETEAAVSIVKAGEGFEINRIELATTARVPGIDAEEFQRHAEAAKQSCPVSKALAGVGEVNLEATLAS